MIWKVTLPLNVEGGDRTAIARYADGLRRHLEHLCSRFQPSTAVRRGQLQVTFAKLEAGTEQTAVGKATYWVGRAVQRESSIRWSPALIRQDGVKCQPTT